MHPDAGADPMSHFTVADGVSTGFGVGMPLLGAVDAAQAGPPAMSPIAYVLLSMLVPMVTQAGLALRSWIAAQKEVRLREIAARQAEVEAAAAAIRPPIDRPDIPPKG